MENQNLYKQLTASGQIDAAAGYIHTLTIAATATVTSGTLTLYDNTAASGTVIWSGVVQAGLNPLTIILDARVNTGLYLSFGSAANVSVTASYRNQ